MNNKILLYPGGFKPFHDGHFKLLNNVLKHNDNLKITHVYIITSPNIRDTTTSYHSYPIIYYMIKYLENLYPDIKFEYILSKDMSPIRKCYNMINESNNNDIFALLCSDKSDTDKNRNNILYDQYKIGGKYNDNKWNINKVFLIPDEYIITAYNSDINIISATELRKHIMNKNYKEFIKGYRYMIAHNIITYDILFAVYYSHHKDFFNNK